MGKVARNPESPLQVDVSLDGVIATAIIRGELDITTAAGLVTCLLAIGAGHPERIVLDLGGLVFVDVAGATALDEAYHLLQVECPVIIRKPQPSARKIFWMTGLLAE
jgi:anti-anti-sigma factor